MKTHKFNLAYSVLTPRGSIGPGIVEVDDERAEALIARGFTPEGKHPQTADPARINAPGSAPASNFEPTRGGAPKAERPTATRKAQDEKKAPETHEDDQNAGESLLEAKDEHSGDESQGGNHEGRDGGDLELTAPEVPLPEGFPSRKELDEAGLTTVEKVRAVEDLTTIKGIGDQRADAILLALDGL